MDFVSKRKKQKQRKEVGGLQGGIKQACEQLVMKQAAVVESQAQLEDSLRLLCAHLLPPPRSPGV